jgi:hypothetical protein
MCAPAPVRFPWDGILQTDYNQQDTRRSPAADGDLARPGRFSRLTSRGRILAATGAAAVLTAGGVILGVTQGGPSYPHSWCGPVISALHFRGRSQNQLLAALSRIQHQDHAPIGALVAT